MSKGSNVIKDGSSATSYNNGVRDLRPNMNSVATEHPTTSTTLRSNTFSTRLNKLMNSIRRMSCLIVMWNMFFTLLMIFFFGD